MKKILFILFFLLFLCVPCWAVTATFQQGVTGYTGTSDCSIDSTSTNEHVTDDTKIRLSTEGRVYILHFDISTIPSDATVNSAEVQLYVDEQNCTDETIGVKAIENPDDSGAFEDNEASADVFNANADWLYKNDTDDTDWSTGESNSFADVDDNANEDTTTTGSCPGSVAKTWDVTTMVSGWVLDASSNGGMLFSLSNSGNVKVKNKRDGTAGVRPLLTVDYTVSGAERRIILSQ